MATNGYLLRTRITATFKMARQNAGIAGEFRLSNHPGHRDLSNRVDTFLGWDNDASKARNPIRATMHGSYHVAVGVYKAVIGRNVVGMRAELRRTG
jgi:hypothetical protein